jgi:preprotein translocase subunit SecE
MKDAEDGMATQDDEDEKATRTADSEESEGGAPSEVAPLATVSGDSLEGIEGATAADVEAAATTSLGTARYVIAAFLVAGMLAAYFSGKLLGSAWSHLAEWPAAVRAVPQLLSVSEDERGSITLVAGAVVGGGLVIRSFRNVETRRWADDVAGELAKVTWPSKETVTNGTVIVVVATVVATIYVTLLDRFWGFVTDLIYRV